MDLQALSSMLKLTNRLIYLEVDGYRLTNDKSTSLQNNEERSVNLLSLKHLKIHSFLDITPSFFEVKPNLKKIFFT
jgi:hypothetical protein